MACKTQTSQLSSMAHLAVTYARHRPLKCPPEDARAGHNTYASAAAKLHEAQTAYLLICPTVLVCSLTSALL